MPALRAVIDLAHREQTKIRFVIAGGLNTVFGLAIFPAFYYGLASLHLHYEVILVAAQTASIVFAYATNKLFVFQTKGNVLAEFAKFSTFHILNLAVNLAALPLLVDGLGWHPVIAQIAFAVIVIVSSYFWHSKISFKPKRSEA